MTYDSHLPGSTATFDESEICLYSYLSYEDSAIRAHSNQCMNPNTGDDFFRESGSSRTYEDNIQFEAMAVMLHIPLTGKPFSAQKLGKRLYPTCWSNIGRGWPLIGFVAIFGHGGRVQNGPKKRLEDVHDGDEEKGIARSINCEYLCL